MSGWDDFPVAAMTAPPAAPPGAGAPAAGGWDAFPTAPPPKPDFDSDAYVNLLADKHGLDPKYVQGIRDSMMNAEAVKGIPILGGLEEKAGAGAAALANPLTGAGAKGGSVSERYAKNLAFENEIQGDFEAAHPIASTAAQVIGGTAATLPLAATGVGARVLGLAGRTLPAQIAQGAASGAAINAADAAVRGNDVGSAALIGGGIGGAAPAIARGVGALASPLVNAVRGIADPAGEAARRVATATDRDIAAGAGGLTPQEFSAARNAGAPVTNLDVGGETTRALARSAANTSPEGRAILNKAIDDRYEGQAQRLTDWLQSTFNYPNVEAQQAAIATEAKTVNRAAYDKAYRDPAGQALWGAPFEQLMQSPDVQQAARAATRTGANKAAAQGFTPVRSPFEWDDAGRFSLAQNPDGSTALPNLQFWDAVKQNLDDKIGAAMRAGEKGQAGDLLTLKNQLVGNLDAAVPSYAQARSGAASFFGADNALEAGREYAGQSGRNFDNRGARAALAKMTDQQRQLFQDGFVDQYVQNIRSMPDRANIMNRIANSDMAREQLNIALGPQRSNELEAMLRVENVMDRARGAIQGNSTTARQLVELGLAGGAGSALSGGGNPFTDPTATMNALLVYGAMKGGRAATSAIDTRVATQVARLLTSSNPAQLRLGLAQVGRNPALLGALRNADTALARAGAVQATPQNQNAPPAPPLQPSQAPQPPMPGARLAPDRNWYVPDPARAGKFLQVMP